MHMNRSDTKKYLDFFKNELKENLLSFWMPRCLDSEFGGYLNCFSNDGSRLVSRDKYTWSQGRFLWMFSKLATLDSDIFSEKERAEFLAYAKNGRDFLLKNVLIGKDDYRCVFLMNPDGTPKNVAGHEGYDLSISADCFVVMGFAAYAAATGDIEARDFARVLGESVWERYMSGKFRSLPYPVSPRYVSHARPMILTNMLCELYKAHRGSEYEKDILEKLAKTHPETFEVFADENGLVHEFKYASGEYPEDIFGQHINPGHTLEDMWFQLEAADILGCDKYRADIIKITKATFSHGWDDSCGGLYHFIGCDGLDTKYGVGEAKDEPQLSLVLDDWGSKLWWVHSEALYTTLLMHVVSGDAELLSMFERVFEYSYRTFPNPDRDIREWIQIRTREGRPQEKVVALPVKDPYHIIRNVALIIELLERESRK